MKIIRPIKGDFIITNGFFGRTKFYKLHKAIDIRTRNKKYPSGIGNPIYNCFGGRATKFGFDVRGGNYIWIKLGDIEARYYHFTKLNHHPGWTFRPIGHVLGWSGSTGIWSTGPHLHLEFVKQGHKVDPEPYLYNYLETL